MDAQERLENHVKPSVVLIVLDGWGIAPDGRYNAISLAKKPNFEALVKKFGSISLCASGECVGLSPGQMGNSEVGHLTIGAGRVIFQDLMRVTHEIGSGKIEKNRAFQSFFNKAASTRASTLHFIGLVSNGGVHSDINHLFGLLKLAKRYHISKVDVHVILDGRDTPPNSGRGFVASLERFLKQEDIGKVATVSGRYYAMDRDNRWERTKIAFDAIVHGVGEKAGDPTSAIESSYSKGITDEFVTPRIIGNYNGMHDGDFVFIFNFRPDRVRQITKALVQDDQEFNKNFDRGDRPKKLTIITMTVYDARLKNVTSILKQERVPETLSNVLEQNRIKQLRIAETEKYAHVTYFFNGLVERPRQLEDRILVPSAREVGTYDKKPEMSANGITKRAFGAFEARKYGFILMNYANADMVGHSGNIAATVKAVETVDSCLGEIYAKWKSLGSASPTILITADHGNAEKMFDETTGQPHTAHTSNPVPLVLVSREWRVSVPLDYKPGLIDLAPSILTILGLRKPTRMKGISIVTRT